MEGKTQNTLKIIGITVIALILIIAAAVALGKKEDFPYSKDILKITEEVTSITANVTSIGNGYITARVNGKNIDFKVLVDEKTAITQTAPGYGMFSFLFKERVRKVSFNDIKKDMTVIIHSATDLRTARNNEFVASTIMTPIFTREFSGIVESVNGDVVTINAANIPIYRQRNTLATSSANLALPFLITKETQFYRETTNLEKRIEKTERTTIAVGSHISIMSDFNAVPEQSSPAQAIYIPLPLQPTPATSTRFMPK